MRRISSLLAVFPRARRAAVVAALLWAGTSHAGVEVKVTTIDHGQDPAKESHGVMWIDEGNLAMDLALGPDAKVGETSTVFQAETGNFLVVSHKDQSYSLLDDESLRLIGEEMENAMLMLDQRMAGLPPEQRQILRQSLIHSQETSRLRSKVKSTSEVATRSGFSTRKFEVRKGEELVREVWVADWDQIPESAEVKAALEGMEGFFQKIHKMFDSLYAGSLGGVKPFDMGDNPFQDLSEMNGFPVWTRNYENGKLTTETRIDEVGTATVPAATFQAPEGYRERTMSGGR